MKPPVLNPMFRLHQGWWKVREKNGQDTKVYSDGSLEVDVREVVWLMAMGPSENHPDAERTSQKD